MSITVNQLAPDFELPSSELDNGKPGKKIKLSGLRGKPVVLAFYPLDFSPVCTNENTCFRDDVSQFEGAQVLGISVDSAWTHAAFAKQLGIKYPLLADFHPKGAVAESYGLYLADKGITKRATVLIDKDGKIAWVKEHSGQRDNQEIVAELKKLA